LESDTTRRFRFGEFTLDLGKGELLRGGQAVPLGGKPFETLVFLVHNRSETVSRDALLTQVWQVKSTDPNTIEQAISEIRRALGDDRKRSLFVKTVRGKGYRFVAEVCEEADAGGLIDMNAPPNLRRLRNGFRIRPLAWVLMAGLGLVVTATLVLKSLRPEQPFPARAEILHNRVQAMDPAGRLLWEYPLPPLSRSWLETKPRSTGVGDLDGDGKPEVVGAYNPVSGSGSVYCLSWDGKVRWVYQPDDLPYTFAGQPYRGSWGISDLIVVPRPGGHNVWVSVNHGVWWPSYLVRLGPRGDANIRFINSGHIRSLAYHQTAKGNFILAGGISNARDGAMLAVLRDPGPPSVSPETPGSQYACDSCPEASPMRYFYIPRSELNLANHETYNLVREIDTANGLVRIKTQETVLPGGSVYIEMSPDFEIRSAKLGDRARGLHELFEGRGLLGHTFARCPEQRQPRIIHAWTPERGWSEIRVP
jgi:DNA-binding winged helix-turn-helix (wHTH) protein